MWNHFLVRTIAIPTRRGATGQDMETLAAPIVIRSAAWLARTVVWVNAAQCSRSKTMSDVLQDMLKRLQSCEQNAIEFIDALKDELPDGLNCANEWYILQASIALTRGFVELAIAKEGDSK